MKFYYYPKCSTCRNAKKWLEAHQIDFEGIDISTNPPSQEAFEKWFQERLFESKKFFNTSGQLYRQMALKDKLASLSDSEKAQLLAANGMLVKRPLVVVEGSCRLIGYKEEQYRDFFLK